MKRRYNKLFRNGMFIFLFLLIFSAATKTIAAPVRVAVLPFDMHAEKDITFLREGILDMIQSRIASKDQVKVIRESETSSALEKADGLEGESRALLAGARLKADYVIFGSITIFGESVSIDSKIVDVNAQKKSLPFLAETCRVGDVIPLINQFVTNINETVFGRHMSQQPTASTDSAAAPPKIQPAYKPHIKSKRLSKSYPSVSPPLPVDTATTLSPKTSQIPNPAFVVTAPAKGTNDHRKNFWKSRNFKALITGIGTADVDQDGQNEIIVVTEKMISIYRMLNGHLVKSSELAKTGRNTYLSLDIADINGNGTPEMYITSIGPGRKSVDSFVIEHESSGYRVISKNNSCYFSVQLTADHGTILLGQKHRANEESIFYGAVHEMTWQGDHLVQGRELLKGRKANLIGLVYGDITHTSQNMFAAYSDWDRICVYNPHGEKIWEDGEHTGGNAEFFRLPIIERGDDNKQFFPLRLRTVDLNKDGRLEILRARHEDLTRNMLQSFRSFKKAKIESVVWDGTSLASQWQTPISEGRASDFIVGDYDNDGSNELIIAVVKVEGTIAFTDAISNLIAFDLD